MSGQRQKWKQAASSGTQIVNTAKTAKTSTFNKSHISDLRVSLIQGTNFSSTTEGVEGKNYNSSKYSALTVSAELIRYQGGGKLKEYTDANNNTLEQFIQPLSFYNDFTDSGDGQPHGVIAHASQRNKNNIQDPTVKINAFGMFGAPNENLVLTVSDSSGGIYDYIKGDSSSQIATGKTAVVVDPSNRVFMGINGQDLNQDNLNYLVSGNKNAQLYVKGDIVVDGSGVQIDKYLVDDIFIGESAAIMGNGLGGEDYPFFNDINNSVPDLKTELEDKESANNKKGYLFVANNSSFYGEVGISGGVTLGDGLTLDNSGYWINGHSTLNISAPSYGTHASIGGINYKSIKANIYDYSYNNNGSPELISTFQHARYDGQDSALLLQHTNPKTSQGSFIFLRSRGPSGETLDSTDVTGQIQFRGYDASNGQYGTGKLTSTADKSITLYGNAVCRLATDVSGGGKNRIDFLTDPSGNNAAIAMIDSDVSNNVYNYILDAQSNAIPTVDYVKSKGLWSTAASDAEWNPNSDDSISVAAWLQPKNAGDEENVYIPGNLAVEGEIKAGTIYGSITADNMTVTDTFKKTCNEVDVFWGLLDIKYDCTQSETENVNFTVEATSNFQKSIRARHSPDTSVDGEEKNQFSFPYSMMNSAGLIVNPENMKNDAVISMIGNRNYSIDGENNLYPTQILFGNFYNGTSATDPSGSSFLGGIRTSIVEPSGGGIADVDTDVDGASSTQGTYSVGNIEFCGSNNGKDLVPFMTYNGVTADISFKLNTHGVITKSTYTADSDPSNSLVDLSYVKNHVSENGSNWEESNSTTIQPKSPYTQVQATTFNATSDEAKKENIQTISGALESINELRGVTYNLKIDESKKTHHGVVAQEIEKIFPNMVSGEEGNKSVAYMEIIGVLIEAVKDLKKRVEQLENK